MDTEFGKTYSTEGVELPPMVKRDLLRLASRVGQGHRLLDLYYTLTSDPYELEVDNRITDFELPENAREGTVLFPVTEGGLILNSFVFGVLGHGFRTRGYEPLVVLCDADMDLCLRKHRSPDDAATCELCNHAGTTTFGAFGLDVVSLGSLGVKEPDVSFSLDDDEAAYRGVDISRYARATLRRFNKKYKVDHGRAEEREKYRRLLETSAYLVDASTALYETVDCDAVLVQHPAYMYGGIYLETARAAGVPAFTISTAWEDQKIMIGNAENRNALPQFEDVGFLRELVDRELDPAQCEAIDELMAGRRDGSRMKLDYVQDASQSIQERVGTCQVGMFTNLMWDASLEADSPTYEDPYEWVHDTIGHLGGREDIELILKVHPAEKIIGTNRGVTDELDDTYDTLPDNVTVLPPDTDVNPYQLLDDLDVGIVWNSTLGLEMSYYGTPAVVVGQTHYRGLDFTVDPDSVEEYRELLEDIEDVSSDGEMRARARRYAYYLFYQKSIPFTYIDTYDDSLGGKGLPVTHEGITNDPALDLVVDRITAHEPVVLPREYHDH